MPELIQGVAENSDLGALHTLTAQAAATVNGADQKNRWYRGVAVVVDLTTVTAATVTVTIEGKDEASGKYYTILASAGLTSTGTTTLIVYPGNSAAANAKADQPLPLNWRVKVVVADNAGTAAVTGKVGACLLL